MSTRTQDPRTTSPRKQRRPCMVLGYDRNDAAQHAASWAVHELMPDGKLIVVHACRTLHTPPSPLSTPADRHHLGQAVLDELLLEGEDELFDIKLESEVSDKDPVSALLSAARHHNAQAIVIGRQHHTRLSEAIGTITTELLKSSPIPIISVPNCG